MNFVKEEEASTKTIMSAEQDQQHEHDEQDVYLNRDEMLEEDIDDTGEPMEDDDDDVAAEPELDEEQQAASTILQVAFD